MRFPTYELFLAWRYLHSRRRRPLARVTGVAAWLSVALGVAALLVTLALGHGWQDEIQDKLLTGTAHIVATRKDGVPLPDWRVYALRLRAVAGVAQVSATTYEGALIIGANGATYAVLRGVAGDDTRAIAEVRQTLTEGAFTPQETPGQAVIGAALAERAGLRVGDTAEIVTGAEALDEGAARRQKVRIAGLFRAGWQEADATWLYLPLPTAARAAGANSEAATAFNIQVTEPYQSDRVAAALRVLLGADFTVTDWQEAQSPFFAALALARRVAFFVIGLLFLLAWLQVLATSVLIVAERRNDIAILGALGARPGSITSVFLLEGALIGLAGAVCGVATGLALCWLGNRYRWINLPAESFALNYIPFHPRASDVIWLTLAAFCSSLLATLYPAWAAARERAVTALQS